MKLSDFNYKTNKKGNNSSSGKKSVENFVNRLEAVEDRKGINNNNDNNHIN